MKLYLVQHGEALPKEENPDRPLSAKGEKDVRALAAFLGKAGISAGRILHSGKTRARQTADLLAAALAPGGAAAAIEGLAPKDPVEPIAAQIADWQDDAVLVGHLPFMVRLVAHLMTGGEEETIVVFQPGSMVCLERSEADAWTINWMLRPELLS
jgi:phosphohistidine phosphatase